MFGADGVVEAMVAGPKLERRSSSGYLPYKLLLASMSGVARICWTKLQIGSKSDCFKTLCKPYGWYALYKYDYMKSCNFVSR